MGKVCPKKYISGAIIVRRYAVNAIKPFWCKIFSTKLKYADINQYDKPKPIKTLAIRRFRDNIALKFSEYLEPLLYPYDLWKYY